MRSEKTIQSEYFPIRKWDLVKIEINLCICFVVVSHGTHSFKSLSFCSLPQDLDGICITLQDLLWSALFYEWWSWAKKKAGFRDADDARHPELLTCSHRRDSLIHWARCWHPKQYLGVTFFFFLMRTLWRSVLSCRIVRVQLLLIFHWEKELIGCFSSLLLFGLQSHIRVPSVFGTRFPGHYASSQ